MIEKVEHKVIINNTELEESKWILTLHSSNFNFISLMIEFEEEYFVKVDDIVFYDLSCIHIKEHQLKILICRRFDCLMHKHCVYL